MAAFSTLAAIAIGGLVGGALSGAGKKSPKTPAPPVMPEAPALDPLAPVKAISKVPKKSSDTPGSMGGTLLTGPSGLASSAPTVRKTLLGS